MYINAYNIIFATFLHKIAPLWCNFLPSFAVFSLCPKESADMLAKSWLMSCRHVIWKVETTLFCGMSGQHFQQSADMTACVRMTCHLGGLGNMTQCLHFQLRIDSTILLSFCYAPCFLCQFILVVGCFLLSCPLKNKVMCPKPFCS